MLFRRWLVFQVSYFIFLSPINSQKVTIEEEIILVGSNCFNILDAKRAFCATPGLRTVSASIDSICCNFYMVLSMFFRLVLAGTLFSLRDINLTLGLFSPRRQVVWRDSAGVRSSGVRHKIRVHGYFFIRAWSLVVTPYWRAPKRVKQLSMATIPLCFEFFWCRVDVLQS